VTIAATDHLRAEFNTNAWSGRMEGGYPFAPWSTRNEEFQNGSSGPAGVAKSAAIGAKRDIRVDDEVA